MNNEVVLERARREIRNSAPEGGPPPVLDPFAGGGSIPLEAQRLGLEAHAGDLNPVAVLINKALIEIPPKFAGQPPVHPGARGDEELFEKRWRGAEGLAEDVRRYGQWMRDEAEGRIGHLYPDVAITADLLDERPDLRFTKIKDPKTGKARGLRVGDRLTPIAWLWARTVPSPDPAARGAHVPLVRSFWLSKKKGKKAWVEPIVDRATGTYRFEVRTGDGQPREGTVGRGGATCLLTGTPIPLKYVREQAQAGNMDARLMAVVGNLHRGRAYFAPMPEHEEAAEQAEPIWAPSGEVPKRLTGGTCYKYGLTEWGDLFTKRQLAALTAFSDLIGEARQHAYLDAETAGVDDPQAYADAMATYLSFALDKVVDSNSSLCAWQAHRDRLRSTFGRQALPMVWDFAETNPLAGAAGDIGGTAKAVSEVLDKAVSEGSSYVAQAEAGSTSHRKPFAICTDPPYYDNISYADLADFFYVWLRRSLADVYSDLFGTLLTPKADELIAASYRHRSKEEARRFFEQGMIRTFDRLCDAAHPEYPVTIFYAFKQSETTETDGTASTGWETFLAGIMQAGFQITGTWPMRTELGNKIGIVQGANMLASSVVLVCRPRPADAPRTTRGDFVRALKAETPAALRELQGGHIAPVDLQQAAIGPGMAVYSRYAAVLESDGRPMRVRTALALINEVLDDYLTEQEGTYDADTRWAVVWNEQHGFEPGPFGDAETLATAKNTSVSGLSEAGVVASGGGKVHLRARTELSAAWDPVADARLTVWESAQHLIRALEVEGEDAAAALLARLRQRSADTADAARDLAYRLFALCEKKGRAEEALAYNGLIVAWPTLERLAEAQAQAAEAAKPAEQGSLAL